MTGSVNRIILVGNIGSDPDIRVLADGTKRAYVSVATTHRPQDGEVDRTEWHRVQLDGEFANVALATFDKGDKVYVEGRIAYDSYERDGFLIPVAEIHASAAVRLVPPPGTRRRRCEP